MMPPNGKTCCFTGHRPNHLPWKEDESSASALQCKALLAEELEQAWQDGYRNFISGMALGADLIFAEAVLACQTVHPEITMLAAIPCEDQVRGWPEDQVERYQRILEHIGPQHCILIQQKRTRGCMLRRDRYMVNLSQRIIALYNGNSSGGTRYTLGYAMEQGLETVIVDPETLQVVRSEENQAENTPS